jgi:hypothetical protein
MTMMRTATFTFERRLSPEVTVRIANIPGSMGVGGEHDTRKQFLERATAHRVRHLVSVARDRMAAGETDIRIDFSDDV